MRAYLISAVMLLAYLPAGAVDGIDMPGFDYANFDAESAPICRNSCGGDPKCQGWTWVKPGIQGRSGHCWLKFKLPSLVKNPCCNSGPRNFIAASDLRAEDHTDRPGFDYSNFDVVSWNACQGACGGDRKCAAWSYARAGVQGVQGRCWLKLQVPSPISNAGIISGVKFRPPAHIIDDNQ